jgi:hypothetical protein
MTYKYWALASLQMASGQQASSHPTTLSPPRWIMEAAHIGYVSAMGVARDIDLGGSHWLNEAWVEYGRKYLFKSMSDMCELKDMRIQYVT